MIGKNRTIPLASKQEVQVQTDVNLIEHYQLEERNQAESQNDLRFSEIITQNVMIKSFSNSQVFQELSHLVSDLKKQGSGDGTIQKRISLIEKQIYGLMKRNLLLNPKSENHQLASDYYSILGQKEKQRLKLEYEMTFNGTKLQRYERRIRQLEKQILTLNETISFTKNFVSENKLYKDFVSSLRDDKRIDARRFSDLESQLRKVSGFSSKDGKIQEGRNQEQINDLSEYFVSEIQKLKKEGNLNKDKLNQAIYSFYELNNQVSQQISSSFQFKSKYESLSSKYQNLSAIFRQQIEELSTMNPSMKGLKNIEELITLISENQRQLEFINVSGWIGIGKISSGAASVSSNTQAFEHQRQHFLSITKQLKLLLDKYPKLNVQLSQQVRFLFSSGDFLKQLIQSESISRLKEIVTYQSEIVRVDNVYQHSNKKDQSLIFNLRVLIKSLLQEFEKIKTKHQIQTTLDEGILEMMRSQVIEGIDVDEIIALYRPLPRVVEVEKYVQKPVYINGTLEKGVPIRTERAIIAQAFTQKAVQIIRQVPVYIQKVVNNTVKQYVEVSFQNQKIVQVPTIREVISDRVLLNQKFNDIEVQKIVPLYEQKIVQVITNQQVVVNHPQIVEIQKPVQLPTQKEYIEVQKIIEKPIYIRQTKDRIKQIQVITQRVFQRDRYIQIQREVPHIITNRETVYLDREVPRFITNTEEKQVNVTEIIQKIVPYRVVQQRVVEVPVVQQKQIIREIQKEVLVQITHFIKGDREEIIKQVEVIVEKPYREEYLITKDVEIEKIVPLYFKEQKPIYVEMQTPYIQNETQIINQEISKIVPVREQVIKQVRVEVPVPVIVQKQIIKIQTVFVDRIVEKIVEVPRVVQVERIVEKIVVIPRIIQKIVEVPRYIEKIVTVQVPCLQIVEVIREIPVIREVQIIKEVIVEKSVITIVKEIEIVEKQRIVEIMIEKQVPKEVEVERRIPTEVIRQIPVEVFRDRIVERIIQIHQVTVKDRQVIVPFKHQVPVQFIVEKPVITQKIIESILKIPQIIQREKAITNTITIPEIVEVCIQKAIQIQVIREIPGKQTIKYIEIPKQIELLKQKIVQVQSIIEVPKQVYLYMDKIVHEYHERMHPIHVPQIIDKPFIVEVKKPQHYIHYKEIPVQVQTNRNVPIRTIIDQIKEVDREIHHETQIEVVRERIKQIIRDNKEFIERQVVKELLREVVVNQTTVQSIEVPSETKYIETINTTIQVQSNDRYIQKVVERIVMMPQIVEVVKHFYEISEVQSPGVAIGTTIDEYTKEFTSVSVELKGSLTEMLQKLKQNVSRQPDLKNVISIIQTHLKQVQTWINFPKIVEIQKPVQMIVQKQKIVLVPTSDHQRQSSLSFLVQKLVTQLRRIKDRNRIELQLDQNIQKLFFKDQRSEISKSKLQQLQKQLQQKYSSLGDWTQSYPFMINSFLQDYFMLNSTIDQLSGVNRNMKEQGDILQSQLKRNSDEIVYLKSYNAHLLINYSKVLDILRKTEKDQRDLSQNQIKEIITEYGLSEAEIQKLAKITKEEGVINNKRTSSVYSYRMEESNEASNNQISTLISKTSKLQTVNQDLNGKIKSYQKQIKILQSQLDRVRLNQQSRISQSRSNRAQSQSSSSNMKVIQQLKTRLQNQTQQKLKRLQQAQSQQIQRLKLSQSQQIQRLREQKSTSSNSDLNNQIRKLSQQNRNAKRQIQAEKRSIESLKQQHERQLQNLKKQHELNLQKKDSNITSIEGVKTRISEDYQRKIKQLKDVHERELERIKTTSVKREDSSKQDKGKQVNQLKDKIKMMQVQLETTKKELDIYQMQRSKMVTTAYSGSAFTSAIKQTSEITERYSSEQNTYSKIQTHQSAVERRKYVSPESVKSKQDDASSRKSSSSKKSDKSSKYKAQMTLKEFMEIQQKEDKDACSTFIMIKIIEKIQEQAGHGLLHSFSPSNIYLSNLNPKNLQSLTIKFGAPIVNKNNKTDGLYLAPQILAGQKTTQKSVVFSLGVIWDELIHGETFFKSIKDIESAQNQFKIRDAKLNPILKNTLFEIMNKDPSKRLELFETRRRLSLQKYIASESLR